MKLTDDEICELWNNMPGGPDGFLKFFGFMNFARRIEEAISDRDEHRIAALEAENAELRKDAERYRWLRDIGDATWASMSSRVPEGAAGINAAIDAAITGAAK